MEAGLDLRRFAVLVVDDEHDNLSAFRFNFRKLFDVHTASSGDEALVALAERDIAVIVTDQRMPQMTGLELLRRAAAVRPEAIGIIISAYADADVLIDAVNLGQVHRYITKPWDARDVKAALREAIERFHLRRENRRLAEQLRQYAGYLDYQAHRAFDFGAIIGQSAPLLELLRRVEQVAPTSSTVLICGETGTGKEMVARAIHLNSGRADAPFVAVNCAALPSELLESELFGHEKGAFTSAISRRKGRFELADGGTLFLDEVGDLPVAVQVKLLRVLQEREFQRVGGVETIKVDVRVISATNRDLERMVEQGSFRQDLYYRLHVLPLELPPLRERGDDVAMLAEHFMHDFRAENGHGPRAITADARAALLGYRWPGNVRELQNIIERACILCAGDTITGGDLYLGPRPRPPGQPPQPRDGAAAAVSPGRPLRAHLEQQEHDAITRAIEASDGNIAAAARSLGINRSTLYFRIKKLGLEQLLPGK